MTACFNTMFNAMSNQSGYCACCAAAGTSARERNILDTVLHTVSIFVIRLEGLRIFKS